MNKGLGSTGDGGNTLRDAYNHGFGIDPNSSERISLKDRLIRAAKGWVKVVIDDFDPLGNLVSSQLLYEKPNLIVDGARTAIARLVATGDTSKIISTFQLGTMGHSGDPITGAVLPTTGDTSLADPSPFSKAVSSYEFLPVGEETSIKYTIVIEENEANPTGGDPAIAYTEAGLFCADGTMFCRETAPAIVKVAGRRVTFEWTLLF